MYYLEYHRKKDQMGGEYGTYGWKRNACLLWGNFKKSTSM
jgi:hypothetical protein